MVLQVPFLNNPLERGACCGKELMEDRLGSLLVTDGGVVNGLDYGELLLQPQNVALDVVLVIIGQGAGADFVGQLGKVGDGTAVEVGQEEPQQ